jgi:hypothetical protein
LRRFESLRGNKKRPAPYPFTSCLSDTIAGLPFALPSTTRTASPSASPSGGAVMMRSSGAIPDAGSMSRPRSRAMVIEQHLVVGADGGDAQPVLVENERAGGNV